MYVACAVSIVIAPKNPDTLSSVAQKPVHREAMKNRLALVAMVDCLWNEAIERKTMNESKRIVLSSDHAAIALRQVIADHIETLGWEAVDIGPTSPESTHYPRHGQAAATRVASGDCQLGIILCGTGQGIMMAANKVKGIRCGVCADTFSARMIRQHNDANMLSIGARVVGEGLALEIVDAFVKASFEGGRHATRVDMIEEIAD